MAVSILGLKHDTYGKVLGEGGEVSGEEADASDVSREAVEDSVSDGHAVVGRRSTSELVEDDEGARSSLRESEGKSARRLVPNGERRAHLGKDLVAVVHLHLERRSVGKDEVIGSHTRVDGVDGRDTSLRSGDVAAN